MTTNYEEDRPTAPVRDSRPAWVDEELTYAIVGGKLHLPSTRATFITAADPVKRDRWGLIIDPPKAQPTLEDEAVTALEKLMGEPETPRFAPDSTHAQMRRDRLFSRTVSMDDVVELAADPAMGDVAVDLLVRNAELDLAAGDDYPLDLATSTLDDWCARHVDLTRPAVPAIELSRAGSLAPARPTTITKSELAKLAASGKGRRLLNFSFLIDESTSEAELTDQIRQLVGGQLLTVVPGSSERTTA
jgi:hypothetical protein